MRALLSSLFCLLFTPFLLASPWSAVHAEAIAADKFQLGSLHVACQGSGNRTLILIPGLGSGAWVWQDTVVALDAKHRVCAVTLAGFQGTPAPTAESSWMALAADSLAQLIRERKLDRPVLIGHSLGGTLALQFATEHSDLIAGVVAVDGLPVFPGSEQMTIEQRKARADMMRAMMSQASQDQFAAQQLAFMQHMGVIDPELAASTAKLQAKSDPAAVARYMAEDFALDLRPQLNKIKVPVLVISPYYAPDFQRAAESGAMPIMSEEQKTAYYRSLLEGVEALSVVSISPARHFVMLDQPKAFLEAVQQFLDKLP